MDRTNLVPIAALFVCPTMSPPDTSGLEKLLADGAFDPADVVAVVGKSEGSGLPSDYGRLLADLRVRQVLAAARGTTAEVVADQVTIAISGGSPGTVAPHITVLTQTWVPAGSVAAAPAPGGLVLGRSHTADIEPAEVGRMGQLDIVTAAVHEAVADAGITDLSQVHMVLVKGPALTAGTIADCIKRGLEPVTRDPGIGPMGSMCFSNDAMALAVGVALGEIDRSAITDATVRRDWDLFSRVALTSSGGEKRKGEVLVLGNRPDSASRVRAGHGITSALGETDGIKEALRSAGLSFECCPSPDDRARIAQVFAKFTLPGSDRLRGARITLLDDHEAHHVAKAVGGALVTSVTGLVTAFVSGGEANSHMGPPGGNPVCAVVRV